MQTAAQAFEAEETSGRDDLELIHVPPEALGQLWHRISHLLPSVIERSGGRLTIETVLAAIARRETHLWIVYDDAADDILAVVGLHIGKAPSGLIVGSIRYTAGHASHRWMHLMAEMEGHARAAGCQRMEIWARKGWQRKLPNYKLTHVLLERDL